MLLHKSCLLMSFMLQNNYLELKSGYTPDCKKMFAEKREISVTYFLLVTLFKDVRVSIMLNKDGWRMCIGAVKVVVLVGGISSYYSSLLP